MEPHHGKPASNVGGDQMAACVVSIRYTVIRYCAAQPTVAPGRLAHDSRHPVVQGVDEISLMRSWRRDDAFQYMYGVDVCCNFEQIEKRGQVSTCHGKGGSRVYAARSRHDRGRVQRRAAGHLSM